VVATSVINDTTFSSLSLLADGHCLHARQTELRTKKMYQQVAKIHSATQCETTLLTHKHTIDSVVRFVSPIFTSAAKHLNVFK
jgi:hypothetical protein